MLVSLLLLWRKQVVYEHLDVLLQWTMQCQINILVGLFSVFACFDLNFSGAHLNVLQYIFVTLLNYLSSVPDF